MPSPTTDSFRRAHRGRQGALLAYLVIWSAALILSLLSHSTSISSYPTSLANDDEYQIPFDEPRVISSPQSLEPLPIEPRPPPRKRLSSLNIKEDKLHHHPPAIPDDILQKPFGLIHLGKSGGENLRDTLMSYLGSQTKINQIRKKEWIHISKPNLTAYSHWIALVRNPVTRLQSWWIYDHSQNFENRRDINGFKVKSTLWDELFGCWPTLDEFCTRGLAPIQSLDELKDRCRLLAFMAVPLRGKSYISGLQHMRFNYHGYYHDLLSSNATNQTIFVIRNEHMLDDVNSIHSLMGGSDATKLRGIEQKSHWRSSNYPVKNRTISPRGMLNLCRHLCNEIQLYKQLLHRGRNILDTDKSPAELHKLCPLQARSIECPLGISDQEWTAVEKIMAAELGKELSLLQRGWKAYREKSTSNQPKMSKVQRVHAFRKDHLASVGVLHMGRCGGESMRAMLQAHPETRLSTLVSSGTWVKRQQPLWSDSKAWIIVVRNPVERLQSWWAYYHPLNRELTMPDFVASTPFHMRAEMEKLYECFPTFTAFIRNGFQNAPICRRIALRALDPRGIPSPIASLTDAAITYTLNIFDIYRVIDSTHIFVVRTERLARDLNGIESMLTSQESTSFKDEEADALHRRFDGSSWPVSYRMDTIDGETAKILCSNICHEIQAYKYMLREAINLKNDDYRKSLKEVEKTCPLQAKAEQC